jgi:NADH dehydrogenase
MILVTGGTGFIGRSLISALVNSGEQVRVLLRPSKKSPNFPKGISVEVAVSSFSDQRSLRAALKGVDFLYHLAGAERQGLNANLNQIDVEGTSTLMQACKDSNLKRVFFLSHIGADRGSAYPVMKAKGISENWIINSGIPYTIFRSSAVYGPGDQFTIPLTRLLRISPYFFFLPGDGSNLLQPIWIDDLITCILLAVSDEKKFNRIIPVGGIEYLAYIDIVKLVMKQTGIKRHPVSLTPEFLRGLTLWIDQIYSKFPVSIFWLDYMAVDRIAGLDSVPREFGLIPARFKNQIEYLHRKS